MVFTAGVPYNDATGKNILKEGDRFEVQAVYYDSIDIRGLTRRAHGEIPSTFLLVCTRDKE